MDVETDVSSEPAGNHPDGARTSTPHVAATIPVHPGRWPLIGHLPSVLRDLPKLFGDAAQDLGPIFWLDMGFGKRFIVCLDPSGFELFRNKQTTSASLVSIAGRFLGEHSLIVQDGPAHRHMRGAMNPPFTPKGLSAAEVGGIFADVIERRVTDWVRKPEVVLLPTTRELTLALIFRMLGIAEDALPDWRRHYEEYLLSALDIPIDLPGFPRWRSRRAKRWLDERLLALVAEARTKPDSTGFVAQLASARDQDGAPLLDIELLDNLRLFALAGHETTASVLAWMLLHLAHEPALWETLRAEAAAAPVPRTPRDLKQFPFAEALFREALRMHPPVTIAARRVIEPLELCGHTIPPGVDVIIPIVHFCRNPTQYPEPDAFRPQRWMGRAGPPTPIETVPFGGGPHFCLGYHAAVMEGVQTMVSLARVLDSKGLQPSPLGPWPKERHFPLAHPHARAKVAWRPVGAAR